MRCVIPFLCCAVDDTSLVSQDRVGDFHRILRKTDLPIRRLNEQMGITFPTTQKRPKQRSFGLPVKDFVSSVGDGLLFGTVVCYKETYENCCCSCGCVCSRYD